MHAEIFEASSREAVALHWRRRRRIDVCQPARARETRSLARCATAACVSALCVVGAALWVGHKCSRSQPRVQPVAAAAAAACVPPFAIVFRVESRLTKWLRVFSLWGLFCLLAGDTSTSKPSFLERKEASQFLLQTIAIVI